MGIWERLGTLLKSYVHSESATEKKYNESITGRKIDPDLEAAYEELNDFLRGETSAKNNKNDNSGQRESRSEAGGKERKRYTPDELKKDFEILGLTHEATIEECKEAYKKLIKIHHPDRHAKHEENLKKATAKTMQVNEAYERIRKFLQF